MIIKNHPILTIFVAIITLGVIALALNNMFGNVITWLSIENIPGTAIPWYKYDTWGYLQNIKNTFTSVTEMNLTLPADEWNSAGDWNALINNLQFMLNYFLFAINVLIYPLRIGFYAVQCLMSLIGINIIQPNGSPLEWLIKLTNFMKNLQIGLINQPTT